ncbi:hypothetical protein FOZ61_010888 [Perkinsus olseni]|uniref:Uncharacterized protein n=1 Tax=Perkinsus olseni TaxID=32597 RepID=A0A7J6M258_PEROL|nr:hypothetical protein FOL46_003780 [Perkinsus olseni]KAF4665476.1 hypothetical protein FOZ61_010888 [Perkinsus olseni]
MPSSPFSREPITLERLYVPRPGILEASDGQVFVSITGTSIDQRLAELILAFNTVSPPTVPIINDHYMKYAYRDARYPSDSMTGLSLPPVPLLHYKATSEVGRFPTTNRICWRLHVLDDDDDLRDFVETAAEGLKLPELNVSNILLCYVSSEWQLRLGPIHKAIRLRYDEKRCDSEVLMEATPYEAGPPSNMPRLDLL